MKIVKNIMSKVFVVFVAMSQVLPTSTISTYAETTSHKLTVQVVGEANVTMSTSDDVAYGVTAEEKLVHEFEDGTELKFNILSDNGITSINEDGVAVTDSQGQALTDYENNTDYDFTYTTKAKDSTIVITVNEAESTDESKEKEETKDASSDTDKSDSKDESKDDSKSDSDKDKDTSDKTDDKSDDKNNANTNTNTNQNNNSNNGNDNGTVMQNVTSSKKNNSVNTATQFYIVPSIVGLGISVICLFLIKKKEGNC